MSTSKQFDRICVIVIVLTLVIGCLFMNGKAFGIKEASKTMGYENRIFDTSIVHSIDIVMDNWEEFIENCESEEYYDCAVVIDGEAIKNVAIRAKGNTSLSQVKTYGNDRYSFKLEFDHYDNNKTYHGLDKLCLNNIIQDNTYMKDYLTYQLMAEMGTASPLCSYAYITVNGEDFGLYLAVEAVEESFLQRNYGKDYGEVYKPDSMNMGGGRGNGREFNMEDWEGKFPDGWEGEFPEATEETGIDGNRGITPPEAADGNGTVTPPEFSEGSGTFAPPTTEGGDGGFTPPATADGNGTVTPSEFSEGSGTFAPPTTEGGDGGFTPPATENGNGAVTPPEFSDGTNAERPAMPDRKSRRGESGSTQDLGDSATQGENGRPQGFDNVGAIGGAGGPKGPGGMSSDDVLLKYIDDEYDSYKNIFENAKTDVTDADKDRLIQALYRLSNQENLAETVDIDSVIRYFVVHNFVVNFDSYTGSMIHNYYLYEEDGVLAMLPWDYNLAFGGFMSNSDATSLVNYPIDSPVSGGNAEDRPMIAWILANEEYKEVYHQIFSEFIEKYYDEGRLAEMIEATKALIAPYVEKDPTKFCTFEEFENGVSSLTEFCSLRLESIKGQLAGEIGSTSSTQEKDILVDASAINISDMGGFIQGGHGEFRNN